jgi:hypothetical protein
MSESDIQTMRLRAEVLGNSILLYPSKQPSTKPISDNVAVLRRLRVSSLSIATIRREDSTPGNEQWRVIVYDDDSCEMDSAWHAASNSDIAILRALLHIRDYTADLLYEAL